MKTKSHGLIVAAVTSALLMGCGADNATTNATNTEVKKAPTVADAKAFVAQVEKESAEYAEYAARIYWLQATNINYDSNWLATKVGAEGTEMGVKFANQAKQFDGLELDETLKRKMDAIKLGLNVPAPEKAGAAQQLSELSTRMRSTYATGKIELDGKQVNRNDLEAMMGTVRDADKLQEIWQKWREIPVAKNAEGTNMKQDYKSMADIANQGAQELGFADLGAMWKLRYEMDADAFEAETDRLWGQVQPLYNELQCHVRAKLSEFHGEQVQPQQGPIRADLLGNMWAQQWGNIYDLVAPESSDPGYDVTKLLVDADYDAEKMVRTGEAFFSSLGIEPLPQTFWERSQITKPRDREVVCHASAWDLDNRDDIRIKMCTKVNGDDFQTVHHELGHNYYQRAYKDQDYLFKGGANGGFHEAIGDMIALSLTPEYLKKIGLLEEVPDASADLGLLMQSALDKIAFMPFGLLMDKWRWDVFSGKVAESEYNKRWWELREKYQGVKAPVERTADHFDPGSKYHIPNNVSYTRYFIAHILQFQFHKAACEMAGWQGPLHRCSIYDSKQVGEKFNAMLEMGASRPWPEALDAFVGQKDMDGSAVVEYYKPLMVWLKEQNKDRQCGW